MKTTKTKLTTMLLVCAMACASVGNARGDDGVRRVMCPPAEVGAGDGVKVIKDPPMEVAEPVATGRSETRKRHDRRRNIVAAGIVVVAAVGITVHVKLGKERSEKKRVSVGFYASGSGK